MRNLLLLLFAAGCYSQMLPPCPPYAAFLPPEMLVGCSLPNPPMMPPMMPPFPPQPYPMMPPIMPPAIVNITMPKHDKTTTAAPTNKFSFPFALPRISIPYPHPMSMSMPMPMGPPVPMMPLPLPSPMMPVIRNPAPPKDHVSPHQSKRNFGVTPVLSYVTRDGHVIYKKTLSDVEALRWLKKEIKKIRYEKTGGGKREDGNNSDSNRTAGEEESKS